MPNATPDAHRFRPLGRATPLVEATAGAAAAVATAAASAIRRKRVFHPDGVGFDGTLQVTGAHHGATLLDEATTHDVVVRLSRGVGLPDAAPDFLGFALRVPDVHGPGRHQDLLFVSAGSAPVARHALVPVRSFDHERYSTLLPYRVGARTVVFGIRRLGERTGRSLQLDDLRSSRLGESLRFALELAEPRGPWEPIGVIELGEHYGAEASAALRFDPSNTGGGIEPIGLVQTVRRLAYRASQAARPTT